MNHIIYAGLDFDLVIAKRIKDITYEYVASVYAARLHPDVRKYRYKPGSRIEIGYANILYGLLCSELNLMSCRRLAEVIGIGNHTLKCQIAKYRKPYVEPILSDIKQIKQIYEVRYPFSFTDHHCYRRVVKRKNFTRPYARHSKSRKSKS